MVLTIVMTSVTIKIHCKAIMTTSAVYRFSNSVGQREM